jgi:hypothetical protein
VIDIATQLQSMRHVHQARALRSLCFTETPWRKHGVGQEGLYETEADHMFAAASRLTEWIVNGHTYLAGLSMISTAHACELSFGPYLQISDWEQPNPELAARRS